MVSKANDGRQSYINLMTHSLAGFTSMASLQRTRKCDCEPKFGM